jgi:hypothetical protein
MTIDDARVHSWPSGQSMEGMMRNVQANGSRGRASGWRPLAVGGAAVMILTACAAPLASVQYPSSAPLTQPSWPAPADPMALVQQAGLVAETAEYLTTHNHAHLDVFVDGVSITVPAAIGIDTKAPGVTDTVTPDGTAHDFQVAICPAVCLSPLHTHDPSGIIHSESQAANHPAYLLGEFFTEWGVRLDASCVGEFCAPDALIHVYLNGTLYSGDPSQIPLASLLEIAIVIGQPPTLIPSEWQFMTPS